MLHSVTHDARRTVPGMIQVSREGFRQLEPVGSAREHFGAHHWVKVPGFLAPPVLADVQRVIQAARFIETIHAGVSPPSVDVCMEPNATSALLELLCNDSALFSAIEAITACGPLTRFSGFVYRLTPAAGHHHNWHNDLVANRRVAMSVNLEPIPYTGGVLQIRLRESEEIIEEVENVGPGDAILFRIDGSLQHRATAVTSGVKTAFAGWFRSGPSLRDELAQLAASSPGTVPTGDSPRYRGQSPKPGTVPASGGTHGS